MRELLASLLTIHAPSVHAERVVRPVAERSWREVLWRRESLILRQLRVPLEGRPHGERDLRTQRRTAITYSKWRVNADRKLAASHYAIEARKERVAVDSKREAKDGCVPLHGLRQCAVSCRVHRLMLTLKSRRCSRNRDLARRRQTWVTSIASCAPQSRRLGRVRRDSVVTRAGLSLAFNRSRIWRAYERCSRPSNPVAIGSAQQDAHRPAHRSPTHCTAGHNGGRAKLALKHAAKDASEIRRQITERPVSYPRPRISSTGCDASNLRALLPAHIHRDD